MTEEELAIALESLPSINAVSVARSPSGLEHGFTWTVTFFSAYTTADGSVELLKSNSSELAGFAAITTPAMVIPAENSSSEVVSAYIRSTQPSNQLYFPSINVRTISRGRGHPRIFKILSQATHFDEAILITMSKSVVDNAQRYFFIEISDPFHYYTDSNASVLVGPIFIDTVALTSQEFAGPYPPQSQVQGTMKGQSIQSMFMEALQTAYPSFAKNLTVIRTDISIANQRQVSWKIIFSKASRAAIAYNMVCSHRYPLLAKSTQPPIPYWTQKIKSLSA